MTNRKIMSQKAPNGNATGASKEPNGNATGASKEPNGNATGASKEKEKDKEKERFTMPMCMICRKPSSSLLSCCGHPLCKSCFDEIKQHYETKPAICPICPNCKKPIRHSYRMVMQLEPPKRKSKGFEPKSELK